MKLQRFNSVIYEVVPKLKPQPKSSLELYSAIINTPAEMIQTKDEVINLNNQYVLIKAIK